MPGTDDVEDLFDDEDDDDDYVCEDCGCFADDCVCEFGDDEDDEDEE